MIPGHATFALAVLAGGQGARMGRPKGELELDGRPILSALLDRLDWTGPTLLVTSPGREHPPGWQSFSHEVVDPVAGQGPLRGLHTALEAASTTHLLALTVDMPEVDAEMLDFLQQAIGRFPEALGIFLRRCVAGQEQLEPFPCLLAALARPVIARRLQEQRRSVHALAGESRFIPLDAPAHWPDNVWTNLNHPQDLQAYLAWRTTGRNSR